MKIVRNICCLFLAASILWSCGGTEKEVEGYWQLFKKKYETGVEEGEFGDENLLLKSDGSYLLDFKTEAGIQNEEGSWKVEKGKDEAGKSFDILLLIPKGGKERSLKIVLLQNKNMELEESPVENGMKYTVVKYYIQTDNLPGKK